MSDPNFDMRAFRSALGRFATGVGVVTAKTSGGHSIGVTVSSFNSVSMSPPLVLFSMARTSLSLDALLHASGYAVNILGAEQTSLSDRFGQVKADKWSLVPHSSGNNGAPLIIGALAHFECTPYAHYDGGDHVIFVARVTSFAEGSGEPLVFYRGGYHGLAISNGTLFAACSW